MLKSYESIFILSPDLLEDSTKNLVEKFKNLLSTSGQLEKIEEWGKRKLAYPIDYKTEGYYVLANFKSEPEFPHELERIYKITEGVIKYIILKNDE